MSKKHKKKLASLSTKAKPSYFDFPESMPQLQRWEKITIGLTFFGIMLLYLFTLAPNVPTGDSGELITSAYILGIPHPPGYPLFTLLGKLFSFLPIGNVAWRINLSSAVFNFAAAIFIFLTIYKLVKYWPAAVFATLFYSLSPIIWEYSLKAEVFPLNNLFVALIFYFLITLREYYIQNSVQQLSNNLYAIKSKKIIYALMLTCGLALSNHHTILLLAIPVVAWLYCYTRENLQNKKTILISLLLFIVGLAFYLYIPISAHTHPYLSWDDPQNLQQFFTLITRADYGTFKLMSTNGAVYDPIEKIGIYLWSLFQQFNPLGFLLALCGIIFLVEQKDKPLRYLLLLAYILPSFVFILMANLASDKPLFLGVFERFFMQPVFFVAIFIGLGIYFLQRVIVMRLAKQAKTISRTLNGIVAASIIIFAAINYQTVNQRNNNLAFNYGTNILNSIEKDAIFLIEGDAINNSLDYLQQVLHYRTDVITLNEEKMSYAWYCRQMQSYHPQIKIPFTNLDGGDAKLSQLVAANIDKHPIYIFGAVDNSLAQNYHLMPLGLITKIVGTDYHQDKTDYLKYNNSLWGSYNLTDLNKNYPETSFDEEIIDTYALAHFSLGWEYQQLQMFEPAISNYESAITINPKLSDPYKNLGIIYYYTKHMPEKAAYYWGFYVRLNPNDKEAAGMQAVIKQYEKK